MRGVYIRNVIKRPSIRGEPKPNEELAIPHWGKPDLNREFAPCTAAMSTSTRPPCYAAFFDQGERSRLVSWRGTRLDGLLVNGIGSKIGHATLNSANL